jgi:hypothetical protein
MSVISFRTNGIASVLPSDRGGVRVSAVMDQTQMREVLHDIRASVSDMTWDEWAEQMKEEAK